MPRRWQQARFFAEAITHLYEMKMFTLLNTIAFRVLDAWK